MIFLKVKLRGNDESRLVDDFIKALKLDIERVGSCVTLTRHSESSPGLSH